MSEQPEEITEEEALARMKALMEHPWVAAAMAGLEPDVVPVSINLEGMELEFADGSKHNSILMTIVDPTGVKTVYLSEQIVRSMLVMIQGIFQGFQAKQEAGILVANPEMERRARALADQAGLLKNVKP